MKGRAAAIALVNLLIPDGIAVSVITLAEVYEGIYYGRDPIGDEQALRQFLRGVAVLDVNAKTVARMIPCRPCII